jgi:hypothetical protein
LTEEVPILSPDYTSTLLGITSKVKVLSIPGGNYHIKLKHRNGISKLIGPIFSDAVGNYSQELVSHYLSGTSFQDHIQKSNLFGEVRVSRERNDCTVGYEYRITYVDALGAGNIPQMELFMSNISTIDTSITINTFQNGNGVAGTLRLGFRGEWTRHISFDAPAALVAENLQNMSTLSGVEVSRSGPNGANSYIWTVTFLSYPTGNIESLLVDDGALFGDGGQIAYSSVDTVVNGSTIRGQFHIEFDNYVIKKLPYNASQDNLLASLATIPNIGHLDVSHEVKSKVKDTHIWKVTFLSKVSPPTMSIISNLHGIAIPNTNLVRVWRLQHASVLGGSFTLLLENHESRKIRFNASSVEVATALNIIPGIVYPWVNVSRKILNNHESYEWSITFLSTPSPIPLLVGNAVSLTGEGRSVEVFRKTESSSERMIQEIKITSSAYMEIQEIEIGGSSAVDVKEIQAISCKASSGYFELTFNGEETTDRINFDDNLSKLHEALSKLASLTSVSLLPEKSMDKVCSTYDESVIGIKFDSVSGQTGDIPLLEVTTYSQTMVVKIETLQHGQARLGGFYTLSYRTETTADIDVFENPLVVQARLESFRSIGKVKVTLVTFEPLVKQIYRVSFLDNAGNVSLLTVASSLSGSEAYIFARRVQQGNMYPEIQKIRIRGDPNRYISAGQFKLRFSRDGQNFTTGILPFNVPPEVLAEELMGLQSINCVSVSRKGPDPEGGYFWYVTFWTERGIDYPLFPIVIDAFIPPWTGYGEQIFVDVVQKGQATTSGSFKLLLGDETTRKMPYNVEPYYQELDRNSALVWLGSPLDKQRRAFEPLIGQAVMDLSNIWLNYNNISFQLCAELCLGNYRCQYFQYANITRLCHVAKDTVLVSISTSNTKSTVLYRRYMDNNMQDEIEALKLISTVQVSKSGEKIGNTHSWKITFSSLDTNLKVKVDTSLLHGKDLNVSVTHNNFDGLKTHYLLKNYEQMELGKSLYARAYAYNYIGRSIVSNMGTGRQARNPFKLPIPLLERYNDSSLSLRFSKPNKDGGSPIEDYQLSLYRNKPEREIQIIHVKPLYSNERHKIFSSCKQVKEEQRVVIIPNHGYEIQAFSIRADNPIVQGSFRISYNSGEHQITTPLLHPQISSKELAAQLNSLSFFSGIIVSREETIEGFGLIWKISFVGNPGNIRNISLLNYLHGENVRMEHHLIRNGLDINGAFKVVINNIEIELDYNSNNNEVQERLNAIDGYKLNTRLYNARTISEQDPSKFCHFPYEYKEEKHEKCILDDNDGTPWCSLIPLANKSRKNSWGNCSSAIGLGISVTFEMPTKNMEQMYVLPINLTGPGRYYNKSHPALSQPYMAVYTVVNGTQNEGRFKIQYGKSLRALSGSATAYHGSKTVYTSLDISTHIENLTYVLIGKKQVEIDHTSSASNLLALKLPWKEKTIIGASMYYHHSTNLIPINASCEYLQRNLEFLPDIDIESLACSIIENSFGKKSWIVEFMGKNRNRGAGLDLFRISTNNALGCIVNATRIHSGQKRFDTFYIRIESYGAKLSGEFKLKIGLVVTKSIPWSTESYQLRRRLEEDFHQINVAEVSRSRKINHGYIFRVSIKEYNFDAVDFNIEKIKCLEDGLVGESPSCRISFVNVWGLFNDNFHITFRGNRTEAIGSNIPVSQLAVILNQMPSIIGIGGVNVTATASLRGDRFFKVVFNAAGDFPLLDFELEKQNVSNVRIHVTEKVRGSGELISTLYLDVAMQCL